GAGSAGPTPGPHDRSRPPTGWPMASGPADRRQPSNGGTPVSVGEETKGEVGTRAVWYQTEASAVARELGVEPERGLAADEARSRLASHGPNRLAGGKKESSFQAFLRQYRDFMQIVLLAAAVISLVVTGDVATSVVLAGLTVFNAVIGLRQEAKAQERVKTPAPRLQHT